MKHFLQVGICLSFLFCCSAQVFPQTGAGIDRYLTANAKLTTIGSASDNLSVPQDLKFSPVPSRKNELWVLNYGNFNAGGNMVIFYDAGKPTQWSEYRHDSHSQHFMIQPTALAMGSPDSGYFAATGDALNNTQDPTSTFMGPVLWDSDTTKFARINQNNWVTGQPLGSHIDMLHQSPYAMGIAFDTLNRYWVFDGYHGCLYHYDFMESHGYGGDDHSDGRILKYKEVKLKRTTSPISLPSHMIVDHASGWLYIVDNGNKRIVRVNTKSGHLGNNLTAPNENLVQYQEMAGVQWQTVDSGFTSLSGIAYFDGRLVVGNYGTGDIRVYDVTVSPKPKYLGVIKTGDPGMIGLTIAPDTTIWYVNRTKNEVVKITPQGILPVAATLLSPANNATQIPIPDTLQWNKTTGATAYHVQASLSANFTSTIYDSSGLTGTSTIIVNPANSTTYYWRVSAKNSTGEGQWSTVWHFKTIGIKPNKPTLLTPINTAMNIPVKPTLKWDSLKVATGYNLQVSTWDMFATTVVDQNNITNASFTAPMLDPITKYYWRVRALNDGTSGDWSDTWSFTTLDPNASVNEDNAMISKILVKPIFPNPSVSNSTISFTLSEAAHLKITVLDVSGKEVLFLGDEFYEMGDHLVNLNSASLSSGVYFCEFTMNEGKLLRTFMVKK